MQIVKIWKRIEVLDKWCWLSRKICPGSSPASGGMAADKRAILGRPVPALDGRCRPTGSFCKVLQTLLVGLHKHRRGIWNIKKFALLELEMVDQQ
jgi:hypothetical protein